MSIKYLALLHDVADRRAEPPAPVARQEGRFTDTQCNCSCFSHCITLLLTICQSAICLHWTPLPSLRGARRIFMKTFKDGEFSLAVERITFIVVSCQSDCLSACLWVLHVSNLTKLFRLNQYLWHGRRGREEGSA